MLPVAIVSGIFQVEGPLTDNKAKHIYWAIFVIALWSALVKSRPQHLIVIEEKSIFSYLLGLKKGIFSYEKGSQGHSLLSLVGVFFFF